MIFKFPFRKTPLLINIYKIERKTIWQARENNNILVLILKGSCIFKLGEVDYTVKEGDLFFIPTMQEYTRYPKDDQPCTMIYFRFEADVKTETINVVQKELHDLKFAMDNALINETKQHFPCSDNLYLTQKCSLFDNKKIVIQHANNILREFQSNKLDSISICSICFNAILAYGMRATIQSLLSCKELTIDKTVSQKLVKAILHIKSNITTKLTLNQLCEHCCITPQHMIRLFKRELSTSPTQYVNMLKIAKAKDMILRSSKTLSMKEIAFELGFDNPHYFSRLFTKITGETPTEFKKRISVPEEKRLDVKSIDI